MKFFTFVPQCDQSKAALKGNDCDYTKGCEAKWPRRDHAECNTAAIYDVFVWSIATLADVRGNRFSRRRPACTFGERWELLPVPLFAITTEIAEVLWYLLGVVIHCWKLEKAWQELTSSRPFTQNPLVDIFEMPGYWGAGHHIHYLKQSITTHRSHSHTLTCRHTNKLSFMFLTFSLITVWMSFVRVNLRDN